MWFPNVSLSPSPSDLSPFSSSPSFSSGFIASRQCNPVFNLTLFLALFPPRNLSLPPVSAPSSICPPSPHFLSTSSLPPSLAYFPSLPSSLSIPFSWVFFPWCGAVGRAWAQAAHRRVHRWATSCAGRPGTPAPYTHKHTHIEPYYATLTHSLPACLPS